MEYPVLIAQSGLLEGQRWLIKDQLVVGREPTCNVVIPDRQVSRQHARFSFTIQGVVLEDLQSKNGTYLNGKPIQSPIKLKEGDEIVIALVQSFIYLSSDATLPLEDLPPEMANVVNLRLDEASCRVWVRGLELKPPLSPQQFNLLALLYRKMGEVVSREDLITAVWGEQTNWVTEQAFDALVRRLRERLNQYDPEYDYIVTVRGHGLRLENQAH